MHVRERKPKESSAGGSAWSLQCLNRDYGVRVRSEVKSQQGHSLSFYEGVHRNKQTNKQSLLGHQAQISREIPWMDYFL